MKNYSSLQIGGKHFSNRLMVGTGKYRSTEEMVKSLSNSESEIITVAVRRVKNNQTGENLLEKIDWKKFWMLPNTAGCTNSDEAIRIATLGRELAKLSGQEENNFVKLEVIPDKKYLLPDPIETLKAAEILIKKGFLVLPYINADPILAKKLEEIGCATVMPLGSPIGSGQGLNLPPMPGKSGQWLINPFTKVPDLFPGAGCTAIPAALLMTIKWSSSYKMSKSISSGFK